MRKFFFILVIFSLFLISCDNCYNVAEEKNCMQKLIWVNANGDSVDLTSGNYGITEWNGFSGTELNIQSQQVPFHDGSVYLDGLLSERELSVTLAIDAKNDLEKRYRLRRELIEILNPKMGEGYLIYHNDFTSKRIKCVPQIPLFENCNSNDSGTPKASLAWTACDPYWEDLEETTVFINNKKAVTINNEGDIPCQIEMRVGTTNAQNVILRNITMDKIIKYNGTLTKNLFVNTNIGKKEAVLEDVKMNIVQNHSGLYGMCYFPEEVCYFSICDNYIEKSYDGEHFEIIFENYKENFSCIFYSETFHAVYISGESGAILKTVDSQNFIELESNVSYAINKFAESSTLLVGVGDNGTIITSSDGTSFTTRTSGTIKKLLSIAYSEYYTKFIIIGVEYRNSAYYSNKIISSNGESWELDTEVQEQYIAIAYSIENKQFVIGGGNSFLIRSFDGGDTWNNQYIAQPSSFTFTTNDIISVEGKGFFLMLCNGNGSVVISTGNGNTAWIKLNHYLFSSANVMGRYKDIILYNQSEEILFVGGKYGFLSYTEILPPTDANDFIKIDLATYTELIDIAYSEDKNLSVIVGYESNRMIVLTSQNNKNWSYIKYSDITEQPYSIRYIKEKKLFIICADKRIFRSQDAISWIPFGVGNQSKAMDIVYNPVLDCYYSYIYSDIISMGEINKINSDFTITSGEAPQSGALLKRMCHFKKKKLYMACGRTATIYSNFVVAKDNGDEGVDWRHPITISFDSMPTVNDIIIDEQNEKVLIGTNGGIQYSYDGINYNNAEFVDEENVPIINGLGYDKLSCSYYAVGKINTVGVIYRSVNGIHWKKISSTLVVCNKADVNNENGILIVGTFNTIVKTIIENIQNVINNISSDSDMNFNLKKGENTLKMAQSSGEAFLSVTYRQKYIGV